ncbi:D-alanyl-D-alanine carboxypeptidase, partial [Streptomyces anulatus]
MPDTPTVPAPDPTPAPTAGNDFRDRVRSCFGFGSPLRSRLSFRFRLRRSVLVPLTAAVVLVAGTGGWYAAGGGRSTVGPAPAEGPEEEVVAPLARSMHLPWPREGQASVAVEGIGSLGTRGEQKPVPIASVTKVMTAYVILKDHPMRADAPGAT